MKCKMEKKKSGLSIAIRIYFMYLNSSKLRFHHLSIKHLHIKEVINSAILKEGTVQYTLKIVHCVVS